MEKEKDKDLAKLIARAESLMARVEALLPPVIPDPDWRRVTAAATGALRQFSYCRARSSILNEDSLSNLQ